MLEFYGDLGYKLRKIVRRADFSDHFRKVVLRCRRAGCKCDATICMFSYKSNHG